jgi:hypothetical protein
MQFDCRSVAGSIPARRSGHDLGRRRPGDHVFQSFLGKLMGSKLIVGALASTVMLVAAAPALSQAPAASSSKAAAASAASKNSLDQEIKLLRKDVRSEKARTVLNALELNADQTAKFLPIYKSFEADLSKLNDLREANIREYAANYSTMTDSKADQLVNQAISYYKKRTDLIANYYDKIRAALGTGTAARFVQVEAMLDNIIDLQIQSNMPLITTPTSG